jgi:predicted alpha/beta hydrolase family esterase
MKKTVAKKKPQIFLIHGGMTFKKKKDYSDFLKNREISIEKKIRWTDDYLDKKLGKDFEIIRPRMPLSEDAKYADWKIHFERHFPFLRSGIILIGSSLGGVFLAKYLSENRFPKRIASTYLICPPFDNTIEGEDLVGGFRLGADLSLVEKNTKNLHLFFSKDDPTVPVSHAEKYRKKLERANIIVFESKNGHFKIETFPEIIEMIKADSGK